MHYFRYSDIFIKFCQEFSYKKRVGRGINLNIFFKMAINISGSALRCRVGRISGNTCNILGLISIYSNCGQPYGWTVHVQVCTHHTVRTVRVRSDIPIWSVTYNTYNISKKEEFKTLRSCRPLNIPYRDHVGQVMRKCVLCHMQKTKVQISLRIRAV